MNSGHNIQKTLTTIKPLTLASICCILLSLISLSAFGQKDTSKVIITGIAYNKADSTPASLVNVYDKLTGIGTITAANGSFILKVPIGDTLVFTSVEYESYLLVAKPKLNNVIFAVYLKHTNYQLPTVTPFSKQGFQKEFKGMNADDSGRLRLDLPKPEKDLGPGKNSQSPSKTLSFGANPNKKVEQQEEQIQKFGVKDASSNKYNREVVKRTTKLNDKQAADFMKFCYISQEVLDSGSDYDVMVAIKKCYKEYVVQHPELKK